MSFCVLFVTGTAIAHWEPTDGHKMHFPQLPDPFGWDVLVTEPKILADDWECSETGPIRDIHFWGSWKGDDEGGVNGIWVGIYPDDRTGDYSKPASELLYERLFSPAEFTIEWRGEVDQGWFNPNTGQYTPNDHDNFYLVNIVDIKAPYWQQEEGQIYWLAISVQAEGGQFGWKTADVDKYPDPYTGQHFKDDAVYDDLTVEHNWGELFDPVSYESLDLAFVITPEPATISMLGIGGALMTLTRRR